MKDIGVALKWMKFSFQAIGKQEQEEMGNIKHIKEIVTVRCITFLL